MFLKKATYGFFHIVGMNRQKRFFSSLRYDRNDNFVERELGKMAAKSPFFPYSQSHCVFPTEGRNLLILCCNSFHSNTYKKFLSTKLQSNDSLLK